MGDAGASLTALALSGSTSVKRKLWGALLKPPDEKKTPAGAHYLGGSEGYQHPSDNRLNARRQYLSERLHAAGPRPVLEALIDVADGADIDRTLENYARIPSSFYRLMGASHFQKPFLVKASTI
jgi:hypothetical protein